MFRSVESKEARDSAGNFRKVVKPYVMDLGSSHKTFINKKEIEDSRYYELREKDTLTFGKSERYIHLYM
jgi:smad nuclear-interacting protein 1